MIMCDTTKIQNLANLFGIYLHIGYQVFIPYATSYRAPPRVFFAPTYNYIDFTVIDNIPKKLAKAYPLEMGLISSDVSYYHAFVILHELAHILATNSAESINLKYEALEHRVYHRNLPYVFCARLLSRLYRKLPEEYAADTFALAWLTKVID